MERTKNEQGVARMKESTLTAQQKAEIKADIMAIERMFKLVDVKIGVMKKECQEIVEALDS